MFIGPFQKIQFNFNLIASTSFQTQIQAKTAISIFVGVLVGVVFYDVGNNAARIISNTAFFQIVLHTILFITIGPAAVVCNKLWMLLIR